ncbi:MAG: metal ABC transporter permease [Cellvibrionaceae bacterium]|nr:metal ABC transporter permease [Cellvibrionaceae bacterium]
MIELLIAPLLAGMALVLATGPLGCFIVWGRMAYFGDTLAHSALLGVVLGVLLQFNVALAILLLCALVALSLWWLQRSELLASDTLLGILSHSCLALGLVGISLIENSRVNVFGLLVGDLLTVGWGEVILIAVISLLVQAAIVFKWRSLLLLVVDPELAKVEGVPTAAMRLLLMLLIAVVIAIAMQIVGVLLITAMLIIPAAGARYLSTSPERMALWATVGGLFAVSSGIMSALLFDLPLGPAIVILAALFFLVCACVGEK